LKDDERMDKRLRRNERVRRVPKKGENERRGLKPDGEKGKVKERDNQIWLRNGLRRKGTGRKRSHQERASIMGVLS
jgi:hypothetical protein